MNETVGEHSLLDYDTRRRVLNDGKQPTTIESKNGFGETFTARTEADNDDDNDDDDEKQIICRDI